MNKHIAEQSQANSNTLATTPAIRTTRPAVEQPKGFGPVAEGGPRHLRHPNDAQDQLLSAGDDTSDDDLITDLDAAGLANPPKDPPMFSAMPGMPGTTDPSTVLSVSDDGIGSSQVASASTASTDATAKTSHATTPPHNTSGNKWSTLGLGGVALGAVAVAAVASGSSNSQPAPTDTLPPTAPTASTVTVNAVKASLGTGSQVSVQLSSIPADAVNITVTLIDSNNPANTYTHQLSGTGLTTQSYTFSNVPDGAYTTQVIYTDLAGNPSTYNSATAKTFDTLVGNPTIGPVPGYDPAAKTTSVNIALPTDAKVGDTLTVTVHDVSGALADRQVTHQVTAQDLSTFTTSVDLTPVLVNGTSYTAATTLTDAALNVSGAATTAQFTFDTLTSVPAMLQTGTANAINGSTVVNGAIDLKGVETGAHVQYEIYQGAPTGVLTDLTTAAASGATYTIPTPTSNGTYSVHVVVTDAAGNTASATTSYQLQGINGPSISYTDTAPAGTPIGDPLLVDHITNVVPVLTLTPDPAMPSSFSITEYSTNGGQTWSTTAPTWTPNTRVDVSVRYTDPSNGLSTLPSNTFATYDNQAPSAAPTDLSLSSTKVGNNQSDIVVNLNNIPADALANLIQVQLLSNGQGVAGLTPTLSTTATGTSYTYTSPSLVDGTYTAQVSYTDAAGNTTSMPVVASTSITPDTTAPVAAPVLHLANAVAAGGVTPNATLAAITPDADATRVEYRITDPATGSFSAWSANAPMPSASTQSTGPQNYTVEARQLDAAGNISPSASLSYTLDNFAGSPSLGTALYNAANQTTTLGLNLPADAQTGDSIALTVHDVTANIDTVFSHTVTAAEVTNMVTPILIDISSALRLNGNSYTASATLTDAVGNLSAPSAALTPFVFDNVALAPVLSLTSDTGASSTDGITRIGTYAASGMEAGSTVEYSIDGTTWGTTPPSAVQGLNNIYVRQTDAAGNVSPVVLGSPSLSFTFDSVAPATPTAALNSDTGATGDGITSQAAIAVGAIEAQASLSYSIDGSTPLLVSLSPNGTPNGTFTPTNAAGGALADGPHTVVVTQTDVAGNATASAPMSFTLDTQVATLGLALVNDNGAFPNDNISSVGTLKLVDPLSGLAVQAEAGANVEYGTLVNGSLTWSTTFTAVMGPNDVWVRQTDVAGNVSAVDPLVPALHFTLTSANAAPVLAVTDTGSVDTPTAVTQTATIGVTPGVAGSTDYEYSLNGGTTWIKVVGLPMAGGTLPIATAGDGTYTVLIHSLDPQTGAPSMDAQASFIQDTVTTVMGAALTLDSSNPLNNPNGNAATDGLTNNGGITLSNVDPNLASLSYTYSLNGVAQPALTVAAVATADPLNPGQFTATIPAPTFGDGVYTVSVFQTDKAGNTAAPVTAAFTLDTTLALPTVTLISDTGNPANPATALDGISNMSDLLVANLKPGVVVDFTVTNSLGTVVGVANNTVPVNANNTANIFSAINTLVSPDGAYTITVTQTDLAGNQQSQALPMVLDTQISTLSAALVTDTTNIQAPNGKADGISQIADIVITGFDPHVDVVNYTFTVTDKFGTVLLDPATNLPYPTLSGSFVPAVGATSHTLVGSTLGLGNSSYTVSLDQIDKAGNSTLANGTTSKFTFTHDTVALTPAVAVTIDSAMTGYTGTYPALTATFGTDANAITNISDLTFSNLEAGADVSYTITNSLTGAVVVPTTLMPVALIDTATGSAAIINPIATNVPGVNDGTYTITVQQTDAAGNVSAISTGSYTLDTQISTLTGAVSLDGTKAPIKDNLTAFDHVGLLGQISLGNFDAHVAQIYYAFTPVDPLTGLANGNPVVMGSMVPPAGATSMTMALTDPALALPNGAYTANFWQVDQAGNDGQTSLLSLNFTFDTQTVVPGVALVNDTGDTYNIATFSDRITTNPMFSPQSGVEAGSIIEYSLDGSTWVQGTGLAGLLHGDGAYNFYVRQTDLVGNMATSAGNTVATGGYDFILDTTKPAITLAADPLTSTLIGGTLTSSTGAISVTSGLDPHASTFAYSIDGGVSWTSNLATLPATIATNKIASGSSITVDVVQIDAAGNGLNQLVPGGKDASLTLVLDNSTTAPVAQLSTDSTPDPLLVPGAATAHYSVDHITNVATITASVTEAGATLSYSVLDATGAAVLDALGAPQTNLPWTGTYTAPAVDPLTHQVSYTVAFTQTDLLGNVSAVTNLPITLDTGANAPTVGLVTETALGAITPLNVTTSYIGQIFANSTEAGAVFMSSTDNGATWKNINAFVPVVGTNNLLVHQIDAAGNVSPDTPFTFDLAAGYTINAATNAVVMDANNVAVVDTTFPLLPSISFTDAGLMGDFVTNNAALTFSAPQNPAGLTSVVEYSADGGTTWLPTGPSMLTVDQTYHLLVRESAFDAAANVTHCSAAVPFNVTLDTTAPVLAPWSNAAELFTSVTGTTPSVAVMLVQYAEGATVDPTNLAAFSGAGALGYTTAVNSTGTSKDGLTHLGIQSDGTTVIELQFTEAVQGSFTQATITPVAQLSVSDVTGNSTAATPTVNLTTLGMNWVIWQNLP
ncbi:MAG: beta strand repeat-containing protein [Leptothrix ochracea]|uniref:beta strand repeat-containing protein n=1 Tax=Leptothrix ochracea TaxID=735331 RepID=UPI0034E2848F